MIPAEKSKYVVDASASLRDAMVLIDENRQRSLIVLAGDRVAGTLSDGDVRRALIDGRLMETPVATLMNTNFISVLKGEEAAGRKILAEGHVFLVPVVDAQNRLVDVLVK